VLKFAESNQFYPNQKLSHIFKPILTAAERPPDIMEDDEMCAMLVRISNDAWAKRITIVKVHCDMHIMPNDNSMEWSSTSGIDKERGGSTQVLMGDCRVESYRLEPRDRRATDRA
jgi:hypothetical protein